MKNIGVFKNICVGVVISILLLAYSEKITAQRISRGSGNWSNTATWTGTTAATGTISSAANSVTVTGVGTNFVGELVVGDPIFTNVGNYIGIIAAIGSNTSLVLSQNAATVFSGSFLRTDNVATSASVPNSASTDVVIRGHTVTLDQNADVKLLASIGSFTTDGTNRTFNINNNLLLLNASNFDANNASLTVSGFTDINGTFQDGSTTGINTFAGLVSVNLGATWTSTALTAPANLVFRGGIYVDGSFNAGSATFNAAMQTISGGRILNFANDISITAGSTVNNNNFINLVGSLNGANAASQWVNIGTLNYTSTTLPMLTGVFNASSDGNTVAYVNASASQPVRPTDYYNLSILNGTPTNPKTFATTGTHTVAGLLLINDAQLTVTGGGKLETRLAQIGRDGIYANNTTTIPTSTSGFNAATNFTGKFDVMYADGGVIDTDNNTFIYSNNGSDAIFQRGGINGLYAVKTTNWAATPSAVVVKFQINARTFFNDNNVATLLIGDGFTNTITREAATARLQFGLNATNNQYTITHPDGTATTSSLQTGMQEVTWVLNRSGSVYNYTAPNGVASTVGNGLADLWIGSTQIVNDLALQNAAMPMNDLKFIYDAGSFNAEAHGDNNPNQPSITMNNLRIFTTTPPATSLSGVINSYTPISAITAANKTLTVGSTSGFAANDKVLIIQMQGASIDNTSPATNANFGAITAYNSAGRYEIAEISSITNATQLDLKIALINTYNLTGSVQLVRMPVFSNATIDGLLTAQSWNGTTGGVLALQVNNTLTLNADIDVSALGFRGGQISGSDGGCSLGDYANNNTNYGQKGEGIAIDANNRARAKLANGGGGGNPHNSGGGGGGNFGAGALGARQWNCLGGGDTNNDCVDGQVAPNSELNGGQGGIALNYSDNRVFMGGGGGSGQQNNDVGTSGANGGGIVIIIANTINGNNYNIAAKGGSVFQGAGGDSGGGGGAGGCIFISCPSYPSLINTNVQGGKGGDVGFASCHGNGGGGGGGVVRLDIPVPALMKIKQGGAPSSRNADGSDCASTANSFFCAGVAGAGGQVIVGLTILPVELLNFEVRRSNKHGILNWATTEERNNDYFEVEKSVDGVNFIALGRVKSKANTKQLLHYDYTDQHLIKGNNYYRLKIVGEDGKFTYSYIKVLYFDDDKPLTVIIFPNPTSIDDSSFEIVFSELIGEKNEINIQIHDILGRKISTQTEKVTANQYKIIFMNRYELSVGVYLAHIQTGKEAFLEKLILR